MSATGRTGTDAVGASSTARPPDRTARARRRARAASWTATMATDAGTLASAARTEACRESPPSTNCTVAPRPVAPGAASPPTPGGTSRRGRRPRRRRGGSRGDREDRVAADRQEALGAAPPRRRPAPAPTGSRSPPSGCTVEASQTAETGAQASAPAVAGDLAVRAAKIIRPVVVWITFVTRTSTWEPIRVGGLLDDDHRAVVEVRDGLPVLTPFLDDPDRRARRRRCREHGSARRAR